MSNIIIRACNFLIFAWIWKVVVFSTNFDQLSNMCIGKLVSVLVVSVLQGVSPGKLEHIARIPIICSTFYAALKVVKTDI